MEGQLTLMSNFEVESHQLAGLKSEIRHPGIHFRTQACHQDTSNYFDLPIAMVKSVLPTFLPERSRSYEAIAYQCINIQ